MPTRTTEQENVDFEEDQETVEDELFVCSKMKEERKGIRGELEEDEKTQEDARLRVVEQSTTRGTWQRALHWLVVFTTVVRSNPMTSIFRIVPWTLLLLLLMHCVLPRRML